MGRDGEGGRQRLQPRRSEYLIRYDGSRNARIASSTDRNTWFGPNAASTPSRLACRRAGSAERRAMATSMPRSRTLAKRLGLGGIVEQANGGDGRVVG